MSHYKRVFVPGGLYFFTVVTHQRKEIFISEEQVSILRRAIKKTMATRPFTIEAMVVMPDHLHAIWQLPDGVFDYSTRWGEIKKQFQRWARFLCPPHGCQ